MSAVEELMADNNLNPHNGVSIIFKVLTDSNQC